MSWPGFSPGVAWRIIWRARRGPGWCAECAAKNRIIRATGAFHSHPIGQIPIDLWTTRAAAVHPAVSSLDACTTPASSGERHYCIFDKWQASYNP